MKKPSRLARFTALRKEERGAEAVEFAFVGPLLFFMVFAILYLLFLLAAQVSVARSASVGVRYAAIMDKTLGRYPTAIDVNNKVVNGTALFRSGACNTSSLTAVAAPNAPIALTVTCNMPNPAGRAVSGLRNALFGGSGDEGQANLVLTADARARRE